MKDTRVSENAPAALPVRRRRSPWMIGGAMAGFAFLCSALVFADWWTVLPEEYAHPSYVGRQTCAECHQAQHDQWQGSHHDLAMDRATPETVLADFNDAELTVHGLTSRMYRDGDRYMIHTEGPTGEMEDFEVKYVFGVTPLQQYMVEFDRPADMPENEIARLQVLRISWDTLGKRWFYHAPPDVPEKLESSDPLHWTGVMQRWNTTCAECHSTDLKKNYDLASGVYHTTFSEIDVSCEACHGPGSTHVKLAKSLSFFWDRKLAYGLPKLKSPDTAVATHSSNAMVEIETCAQCHSRRRVVHPDFRPGEDYHDYYANELLQPLTYFCDGQIRDEVFDYGSFIQSKMFHKGIRCTDCHDPHTARLKHEGNNVCTSCHQHPAGKYDTPAHHNHRPGSKGAQCVECHMPTTTYMEVDPRRDHSLRVPRPDLSVELGVPNACTGCHLEPERIFSEKHSKLKQYADWILMAEGGDEELKQELSRLDSWAAETVEKWYGRKPREAPEFAATLKAAWERDPAAHDPLLKLALNRRASAMVRASAAVQLAQFGTPESIAASEDLLRDPDPQVRAAAAGNLQGAPAETLLRLLPPLLEDPVRLVRTEAARVLAEAPSAELDGRQRQALRKALEEFKEGVLVNNDRSFAWLTLGILYESQGDEQRAIDAYETAIRVEPAVVGPRTNLAELYDQRAARDEQLAQQQVYQRNRDAAMETISRAAENRAKADQLRAEELPFLARDARSAPQNAAVQYRYGLALYLAGNLEEAETALRQAVDLEPQTPEFTLGLALLYQKLERWSEAIDYTQRLLELRPDDASYHQLLRELRQQKVEGSRAPSVGAPRS
jgi:tetratricopeptide (TPR) repeat protein